MKVLNRINGLLGILFVAILLEALFGFVFAGSSENMAGFGFKILEEQINENKELQINPAMERLIETAYFQYSNKNLKEAKMAFEELIQKRVSAGGSFNIKDFVKILPNKKELQFKLQEKKDSEAGLVINVKEGRMIHKTVEEIGEFISNQDAFFQTMLYVLDPGAFTAVVKPNKDNKIEHGGKFYYYFRNNKGELKLKKYSLFWFDWDITNPDVKNGVMIKEVNNLIKDGELKVLLGNDYLYEFEPENKVEKSFLGKAISAIDEYN